VKKPAVLYISYDGMLEPLGQSQVLAYLEGLATDHQLILISFEKKADWSDVSKREALQRRIATANIKWVPLRYHKSPSVPATLFDISHATARAIQLAVQHKVKLVHARSYIPALVGLAVKKATGAKLIFDMRGLWPDERVDGNIWPKNGPVYRTVKALEQTLLLAADHTVTLTHASQVLIEDFPYLKKDSAQAASKFAIDVIPTCADLERFKPQGNRPEGFVLGYLGSVGTWYLFDEVLECFKLIRLRRPDAKLLVVNRNEHVFIRSRIEALGIDPALCELVPAEHKNVPALIAKMTVGAAIIVPAYSKIASAPTKVAEYLGCGVPCLGNDGVGDMHAILEGERTGVSLSGFTGAEREAAVERLFALLDDPELAVRCRAVAERLFSLPHGVDAYRRIYAGLLQ
jgi:glycosyltransferase involved in cell wall biosynthesis